MRVSHQPRHPSKGDSSWMTQHLIWSSSRAPDAVVGGFAAAVKRFFSSQRHGQSCFAQVGPGLVLHSATELTAVTRCSQDVDM